jgi:hypothetical protein
MIEIGLHVAVVQSDASEGLDVGPENVGKALQHTLWVETSHKRLYRGGPSISSVELITSDIDQLTAIESWNVATLCEHQFQPVASLPVHQSFEQRRGKQVSPDIYTAGLVSVGMVRDSTFPFQVKDEVDFAHFVDSSGFVHASSLLIGIKSIYSFLHDVKHRAGLPRRNRKGFGVL